MTVADVVRLALKASLLLLVFSAGLRAEPRHATTLFREPKALLRMLLAMFVVMPALALAMAAAFDLHPAVRIALVALALSPVPPLMPGNANKVSRSTDYTIGLLVTASLVSIVFIPVAMVLLDRMLGRPLSMSAGVVAKQMLLGVLAPLAAGMLVRQFAAKLADRLAKPASTAAFVVLLACLALMVVKLHRAMWALVGNGTILAFVVFITLGLAVGYLLAGPDPERRGVLGISTAARHPGIAVAIAQANYPEQKLAPAAVLICLLLGIIAMKPYAKWVNSKREHAGGPTIHSHGT